MKSKTAKPKRETDEERVDREEEEHQRRVIDPMNRELRAKEHAAIDRDRLTFCINRADREQVDAKAKYVKACKDMARNLTEAAQRAEDGLYVSETVMSSSLVQDIPKLAVEYKAASETGAMLRQLKEETVS